MFYSHRLLTVGYIALKKDQRKIIVESPKDLSINQYNLFQQGKIFSYKNSNTIHTLHNKYFKANAK